MRQSSVLLTVFVSLLLPSRRVLSVTGRELCDKYQPLISKEVKEGDFLHVVRNVCDFDRALIGLVGT